MQRKARRLADSILSRARSLTSQRLERARADRTTSARLAAYLASERNYRKVQRQLRQPWAPLERRARRASVPFLVAALGQLDCQIPRGRRIDGLEIARVTIALSRHLEENCQWRRLTDHRQLVAGDLVFTRDAPCCAGIPDHAFVFMGWSERSAAIAQVIDDRGHTHARPLFPEPRPELGHRAVTAFSYALRSS